MFKDGIRNLRLESIYHAVETSFGAVRSKIVSGLQATAEDIDAVVHFAAAQLIRTPKFRSYWHLAGDDKREAQVSKIDDPAIRAAIAKTVGHINTNHQQILSLLAFPTALGFLNDMRAHFFKSPTSRAFITSDAPCSVIDYKGNVQSPFASLAGSTVNVLMPLSPDLLVLFDKSDGPHEMTLVFPDHPFISHANAMIWAGAAKTVVLPEHNVQPQWLNIPSPISGAKYIVM